MKKFICIAAVAMSAAAFSAEVVEIKTAKDWAKGSGVRVSEAGVWDLIGSRDIKSTKSFKVDPAKKYTLSFEVRKSAATQKVMLYAGFWPLDDDMLTINPHNARCERNSETILTADAKAGSKSIRINEPKRWRKGARLWCVALNDKKNCTGLDMNVICNQSCSEQAADGSMEVKLKQPLTKDYKANTPIHFHSDGPGMYSVCKEKDPGTEWETITSTVSGIQTAAGIPANNKWWVGSKYGKIRILLVSRDRKSKVQLRNVKLTIE